MVRPAMALRESGKSGCNQIRSSRVSPTGAWPGELSPSACDVARGAARGGRKGMYGCILEVASFVACRAWASRPWQSCCRRARRRKHGSSPSFPFSRVSQAAHYRSPTRFHVSPIRRRHQSRISLAGQRGPPREGAFPRAQRRGRAGQPRATPSQRRRRDTRSTREPTDRAPGEVSGAAAQAVGSRARAELRLGRGYRAAHAASERKSPRPDGRDGHGPATLAHPASRCRHGCGSRRHRGAGQHRTPNCR